MSVNNNFFCRNPPKVPLVYINGVMCPEFPFYGVSWQREGCLVAEAWWHSIPNVPWPPSLNPRVLQDIFLDHSVSCSLKHLQNKQLGSCLLCPTWGWTGREHVWTALSFQSVWLPILGTSYSSQSNNHVNCSQIPGYQGSGPVSSTNLLYELETFIPSLHYQFLSCGRRLLSVIFQ